MKKEMLRGALLLFVCSGFWVLMLAVAAPLFGLGFAQDRSLGQGFGSQGGQADFGSPSGMVPQGTMLPGQVIPPARSELMLNNNAMLPNQGHATFNTATQEVVIPFEIDTSRLLAFSVVVDNSVQTLTVLDPINQTLVVYHIYLGNHPNAGKCHLESIRNISADLKFDDYGSLDPTPKSMRATVEQAEKEK
jgi:hypothetical protein